MAALQISMSGSGTLSQMGQPSLRSLPRVFVPGATAEGPFELPPAELDKFRKVLRLSSGDQVAVLPNDGSLIRCELDGREVVPLEVVWPKTEPSRKVTIIQALPKGDRLETVLRMGTELGVSQFTVFPAIRSVAKWEPNKIQEKVRRYEAIIREAAEQSYRSVLPGFSWKPSFQEALASHPNPIILSEREDAGRHFSEAATHPDVAFVVGPEGGWDPKETALIGDRGFTMGPLVLRTDTAGIAAAAIALLTRP
jgi:16S rRNA (uracil1498-N3)-methyltransferase